MTIQVVFFERSPSEWVAQCLQYDIGAQADNLLELVYELQRSLVGHVVISIENGLQPFESLPPAPAEYWDKWRHGMGIDPDPPLFRLPESAPSFIPSFRVTA